MSASSQYVLAPSTLSLSPSRHIYFSCLRSPTLKVEERHPISSSIPSMTLMGNSQETHTLISLGIVSDLSCFITVAV